MAEHSAAPTAHTHAANHQAPITAGKVAMWLFLATEVMFFTGLIGSYIVLRSGSPAAAYSNLFQPGTDVNRLLKTKGVRLVSSGTDIARVAEVIHKHAKVSEARAHEIAAETPHGILFGVSETDANKVVDELTSAGATALIEDLKVYKWPLPYDEAVNPLSINLTAANTFILICSSVTMVLGLGAIQRGDKRKLTLYLLATVVIGSIFLGVQIYEYYQLMLGHHYPPGISQTGHFRPGVSLFGSCFFTMTGFHGAHVAGGVVMLTTMLIGSITGRFTRDHHAPVELVGLYWHFVDLVWIILFTVVYLI